MISREAATVATAARDRPRRRRALGVGLLVVLPLVVVGGLLVWPGELAVVRLGGVSLGWWAAAASGGLALLVLGFRPRPGPAGDPGSGVLGRAFVFAAIWLSPAVLVGLGPLVLADGTRGLWAPLVLVHAACLVTVLLAAPWAALPAEIRPTLVDLVRYRRASGAATLLPLGVAASACALLFLWAQLAAGRELARAVGWPDQAVIGLAVLVLALLTWAEEAGRRLAPLSAAVAILGLVVPLAAVLVATDPVWPRVFDAVASRPRVVFESGGPWTRDGYPVRGGDREVRLRADEEQRLTLLGPGHVRVEPWEGGAWSREVGAPLELVLRPGDRLVVPDGFPIRFQAGRAIPGAPASGPDWLDPDPGPDAWRPLVGLAVTLLLGALGLAPIHGALPAGRAGADRAVVLGAVLVALGLAAVVLWALYAAWLTPEVYLGGVLGGEVFGLPARVAALGGAGPAFRGVALLGLAGGGLAAGLAALRGVARRLAPAGAARAPAILPTLAALAGLLAALVPVGPWPVLVAAFGLAGSACAPATLFACWSDGRGARGLAAGAGVGLVAFAGLAVARLAGLEGWPGWLTTWPVVVAAPLNVLAAGLLGPGPRAMSRSPLPPDAGDLHP